MFKTKLTLLICFISLFLHGQQVEPLGDTNFKVTMSGQMPVSELQNVSLFQQSEAELAPMNRTVDERENQHSRYHILVNGTPVKGIHVTRHYNPRLQETTFIVPRGLPQKHNLALSTIAVSYSEALDIVKETVKGDDYPKLEASPTGLKEGLVIVPQAYDFKKPTWILAYEIDVQTDGPWQSKRLTVDANTGEVIFTEERLCSFNPGTADTYHHGTRPVVTTENNGTYIMQDQTRGSGIVTNNYNTNQIFSDADDCWDDPSQAVAGDVHWGSAATYDFYLDELGQDGLDGNGLGVTSYVHLDMANAYWDGSATFYGDGDSFGSYDLPFTHMSVIAHEITHGVTQYHSGLIYSGESGAMNESISDIIGASVEYSVLGSTDWRLGNDVSSSGSYFRNLADPNDVQMAHTYMGEYWSPSASAVHTNSSIGNFWFYLLVEGGSGVNDNNYSYTVDSIGWESAWLIAHNTWTTYLTPSSDYPSCAELSIVAATNLFGACSDEVAQVRNAWAAVGVLSSGSDPAISASPSKVCEIPTEVNFFVTGEVDNHTWDFGDGNQSNDAAPIHTYQDVGSYTVSLTGTDCNNEPISITETDFIIVDTLSTDCDTTYMDMNQIVNSCSGILVDDGGAGNYANNVYTVVEIIAPDARAYEIDIQDFAVESGYDVLYLYVDSGNGYEFYQSYSGNVSTSTFTVEGERLQFIWDTDGSVTYAGFVIAWECVTPTVPVADFSTENNVSCNGYAALQDESTGYPDSWTWFLDGVEVSTEQNPLVTLPLVGMYDVGLIACNNLGCDTVTVEDYITYNDQLPFCDTLVMADDLETVSYSCEGILVDDGGIDGSYANNVYSVVEIEAPDAQAYEIDIQYFNGESCCDYLRLYADYGNGYELVQSYVGSPATGSFIVEAERIQFIWDTDGSVIYAGFIVAWQCIFPSVPIAAFSTENTISCNGYADMQDESTGFPDSWTWFLDGVEVSTEQNPSLNLPALGMYDVGLIACNNLGCDTVTVEDYINYDDQLSFCDTLVMADDLETISYSCEGVLLDDGGMDGNYDNNVYSVVTIESPDAQAYEIDIQYFYGQSCCDYLSLYADYGNGYEFVQSFVGSPSTGPFIVEAERVRFIWDTNSSSNYPGFVVAWQCLTPTVPTAAFSTENTISCNGYAALQDESTGFPDSWTWFLDGVEVSTEENPLVTLPVVGMYDVGLVACNSLGCDTVTIQDYLTYDDELPFCDTLIMADDLETISYSCEGVLLDDGGIDGYYANNVYSVVEIESPNAIGYEIDIQYFNGESCCDYLRLYADFGNGYELVQSYVGSPATGPFTVEAEKLQFIWDTDGSITDPGFVISWQCISPTVPTAAFSTENTISCDGYIVLEDESTGYPDSWTWLIDGVEVSTEQSPLVNLPAVGTYDVGLIACNNLGCDTLTVDDYVTYDDQLSFCDTIVMIDNLDMVSYSCEGILVDNGGVDGNYSNGIYSIVQVETPGAMAYQVDIQSFHGEGCCDYFRVYADYENGSGYELIQSFVGNIDPTVLTITASKIQFIWSTDGSVTYPGFVVGWQCIGANDAPLSNPTYEIDDCSYTTTLNSNAFNADQVVWDLGDGNTAIGLSVTHTYLEAGNYMVHLEASNANGVSADSMMVETIFEVATFEIPDPVIVDQPTTISLSSHAPGDISNIQWFLDGVLVSSSYAVSLELAELGSYTLNCVVTDTNGCISTHSETILAVAVDIPQEFKDIAIFPNPTNGELQIRNLSGLNGVAEIALLNTVGQVITTLSPESGTDQVSLSLHALPTGIYVLKIQNDDGKSFFKKVVKTD